VAAAVWRPVATSSACIDRIAFELGVVIRKTKLGGHSSKQKRQIIAIDSNRGHGGSAVAISSASARGSIMLDKTLT
jgi:hypothetical protein